MSSAQERSGPTGHGIAPGAFILGHLREYQRDPLALFSELQRSYGDVVQFRIGPQRSYLVSHPDDLRYIFTTNAANYERPSTYDRGRAVFGEASFASRGDTWVTKRRTVNSLFHPKALSTLSEGIEGEITRALKRWERYADSGSSFDVVYENLMLTLGISSKILLGFDPADERDELCHAVEEVLVFLKDRLAALIPLPEWIPTRGHLRFRRAMAVLDAVVYRIIDRCREHGGRDDDVISALVTARDRGDAAFPSDRALRDEIMTFFLAGFHTTADSFSWCLFQIASQPEIQERLHEEVSALGLTSSPATSDLPKLPFAKMVMQESMRLYSAAHFLPRRPIKDDELRGIPIPKGSIVFASQWVTHRHPDVWKDPDCFDAERFSPHRLHEIPRHAYFPFGLGPQTCIGRNLAMMELPMMLAAMMQRFRVELVPGQSVEPCAGMTMRPNGEIRVTLHRRPQASALERDSGELVEPRAGRGALASVLL